MSMTDDELKNIRDSVLLATRIAILMLYKFSPYGRHFYP